MNLEEQKTWQIYDSSKIQEFMHCPRKYFFRHILGWQVDEPNIHLVFGEAWHRAMEALLNYGYSKEALTLAQMELDSYYRIHFSPLVDDLYYPKTPGFAQEMLAKYVQKYPTDHRDFDVLMTETAGSVSLDDVHSLHFRLDGICRGRTGLFKDKYFVLEHKTASRNSGAWRDQWSLKIQIGIYSHVAFCAYGPDTAGVLVNGAFFNKSNPDFIRLPILKTTKQMQGWLTTVSRWIHHIDDEMEMLVDVDDEESNTMLSFPMNTESCTNYMKLCAYHDLCTAWQNPLSRIDSPPSGFRQEFWDPTSLTAKNVISL